MKTEFQEIECLNEVQAVYNARQEEREKWQAVIADKDDKIQLLQSVVERLQANGLNFHEVVRLRSKAAHDEAQALYHAREQEREKWQTVVADKDARLADKDAQIAELQAQLENKEDSHRSQG